MHTESGWNEYTAYSILSETSQHQRDSCTQILRIHCSIASVMFRKHAPGLVGYLLLFCLEA